MLDAKVAMPMNEASPAVRVIIEVSRGGFIKRHPDGAVDFVSPLPCPFNYGSVCDSEAADGDPQDAVVLGPPLAAGSEHLVTPWQRAVFLDDGLVDDKWICGVTPPTEEELKRIHRFFTRYAWAKRVLNRSRGRSGCTRFDGLAPLELG